MSLDSDINRDLLYIFAKHLKSLGFEQTIASFTKELVG